MAIGPLARLILQGAAVFTSVFGRAFLQAYQQALVNARKGGAHSAAATAHTAVQRSNKMQLAEARQVLNVEKGELMEIDMKKLREQYERIFDANDPKKGGSFYLQSKIFRAKEALDMEIEDITKGKGGSP
eukprot:CAMPEP_0182537398 /NCGR_PEP_ID=MMETSP1323-20130603/21877_1 /TAXON_ID=236787 /ORGANISM="Florenciella parvula, Strain RCC1693" /LENGTH=129 /DNA_ID=CAMNT_0024747771 /DNA_START=53 /DNA_END=442 /DNA_ORIENTATION=+